MIKNERQHRITRAQIQKLRRAVRDLKRTPSEGAHPVLVKAQREALESQLADLMAETHEYERLRHGKRRILHLKSLDELPRALISARIAKGLTQRELAAQMGWKEQQIQRYEASNYATASFERIKRVIDVLKIRIREQVLLEQ